MGGTEVRAWAWRLAGVQTARRAGRELRRRKRRVGFIA
jgi:hypothetical protein